MIPILGLPGQAKKKTMDPRMMPKATSKRLATYHLPMIRHGKEIRLVLLTTLPPLGKLTLPTGKCSLQSLDSG